MRTLIKFSEKDIYQPIKSRWSVRKEKIREEKNKKSFLKLMLDRSVMFTLCVGFFILGGIQGIGVYLLLLGCMFFIDLAADEKML